MLLGDLVVGLLDTICNSALYPDRAPADAPTPYTLYTYFTNTLGTLGGNAAQRTGTVQLDVYASTHRAAALQAQSIENVLGDLYSGERLFFSPTTLSARQISNQYLGVDRDVNLHRVMLEYSVWYTP
jgi:hypothetical protein